MPNVTLTQRRDLLWIVTLDGNVVAVGTFTEMTRFFEQLNLQQHPEGDPPPPPPPPEPDPVPANTDATIQILPDMQIAPSEVVTGTIRITKAATWKDFFNNTTLQLHIQFAESQGGTVRLLDQHNFVFGDLSFIDIQVNRDPDISPTVHMEVFLVDDQFRPFANNVTTSLTIEEPPVNQSVSFPIRFTDHPEEDFNTNTNEADFIELGALAQRTGLWSRGTGIFVITLPAFTFAQVFTTIQEILERIAPPPPPPPPPPPDDMLPLRPVPQREFHWQGINSNADTNQYSTAILEVFDKFAQVIDARWFVNNNLVDPFTVATNGVFEGINYRQMLQPARDIGDIDMELFWSDTIPADAARIINGVGRIRMAKGLIFPIDQFKRIFQHELGHILGLSHTDGEWMTMRDDPNQNQDVCLLSDALFGAGWLPSPFFNCDVIPPPNPQDRSTIQVLTSETNYSSGVVQMAINVTLHDSSFLGRTIDTLVIDAETGLPFAGSSSNFVLSNTQQKVTNIVWLENRARISGQVILQLDGQDFSRGVNFELQEGTTPPPVEKFGNVEKAIIAAVGIGILSSLQGGKQ